MHSYGGIVGIEALRGFGKTERVEEGKQGDVIALIYLCTFLIPEGWKGVDVSMGPPSTGVPSVIQVETMVGPLPNFYNLQN